MFSNLGVKLAAKVTRFGMKHGMKIAKAAVVVGFGGTIVGTVSACRASMHVDEDISKSKEELKEVRDKKEQMEKSKYVKELSKAYLRFIGRIARRFAIPVIILVCSFMCILGSYTHIMRKNAELTAVLASTVAELKARDAAIEHRFGSDVLTEIQNDITTVEKQTTKVNETTGMPINETEYMTEVGNIDGYRRIKVDSSYKGVYRRNREICMSELDLVERQMNQLLRVREQAARDGIGWVSAYDLLKVLLDKANFEYMDRDLYFNAKSCVLVSSEQHPVDFKLGHRAVVHGEMLNKKFFEGAVDECILAPNWDTEPVEVIFGRA